MVVRASRSTVATSNNYFYLYLPPYLSMHPTFNVELLQPYNPTLLKKRTIKQNPPFDIDLNFNTLSPSNQCIDQPT